MKKLVIILQDFGVETSDAYEDYVNTIYKGDTVLPIFTPDDDDASLASVSDKIDDSLVKEINSLPGGMIVVVPDELTVLHSFALTISEMYGCELICLAS